MEYMLACAIRVFLLLRCVHCDVRVAVDSAPCLCLLPGFTVTSAHGKTQSGG